MKFIGWVLGLPLALVLIGFAVANRTFVKVSLDPVSTQNPWFAMDLPIWSLLFAGIFIGLLIGWIAAWLGQGKWRKAAREARTNLDMELARKKELEQRLAGQGSAGGRELTTV